MFPTNKVAENVFATAGSIVWSVVVIPQIVKSYRTKSTHGLSPWLMLLWAGSAFTYGPYAFTQHLSIAFCVQAQLFYLFTCISFSQCLYYSSGYSVIKSISVLFALLLLFAGFETGSIFALRRADSEGLPGVAMAYAYMTNAFNVLGLLPQYYEIFRLREVVGISLIFLALDVSGGVLSFLSLFFRPKLDVPAFVLYLVVSVADLGIIILAGLLNPSARRRKLRMSQQAQQVRENDETRQSTTEAIVSQSDINPPVSIENQRSESGLKEVSSSLREADTTSSSSLTDVEKIEREETTSTMV